MGFGANTWKQLSISPLAAQRPGRVSHEINHILKISDTTVHFRKKQDMWLLGSHIDQRLENTCSLMWQETLIWDSLLLLRLPPIKFLEKEQTGRSLILLLISQQHWDLLLKFSREYSLMTKSLIQSSVQQPFFPNEWNSCACFIFTNPRGSTIHRAIKNGVYFIFIYTHISVCVWTNKTLSPASKTSKQDFFKTT